MPESIELIEMRRDVVTSSYPDLRVSYRSPEYFFGYSPRLIRTNKNYYDFKSKIPEGLRVSTAAEELAVQLGLERAGQNPRKASDFDDIFTRRNFGWHAIQRTETGLRVPKGWEGGRYQTDAKGNIQYPRIVLIGDQEIGEALVPCGGNWSIVIGWNEVFGIPILTADGFMLDANYQTRVDNRYEKHTTHFDFNSNPPIDEKTGRQDVGVWRENAFCYGVNNKCLSVSAGRLRSVAFPRIGVRLVQGPLPEIEKLVV